MSKFRRGHTLIEVLVAMVILTILFVFISSDMMAVSHEDKATDQTVEIAASNYYLGLMKTDQNFWTNVQDGTGRTDACGNALGAYTNSFPSPPAQPQWNTFQECDLAPAFVNQADNGQSKSQALAMRYMWNATIRPTDSNVADLTVWIQRDGNAPVLEYHSIRYKTPSLQTPPPYTPTPSPSQSPGGSPPPSPTPRPTQPPTPTPSPTPFGI